MLTAAASAGVELVVVDASADFRFADPAAYAAVYGHAHETPARLKEFTCAVPEQLARIETPHAAHPGCFATTMLLPIVPLAALGFADEFFVSAVTGSTGAGRTPRDTTHHPLRQSNLFAYQALKHRHDPEVRALIKAATGRDVRLSFVPHSGPFARGIHATIFLHAKERMTQAQVNEALREYYRGATFVRVDDEPPKMKDIAATNYAALHAVVAGRYDRRLLGDGQSAEGRRRRQPAMGESALGISGRDGLDRTCGGVAVMNVATNEIAAVGAHLNEVYPMLPFTPVRGIGVYLENAAGPPHPRSVRRSRRRRARLRPPRLERDARAREPRARVPDQRTAAQDPRRSRREARGVRPAGLGTRVLRQQRRRGERERAAARVQGHGPHEGRRDGAQLPRPDRGRGAP